MVVYLLVGETGLYYPNNIVSKITISTELTLVFEPRLMGAILNNLQFVGDWV